MYSILPDEPAVLAPTVPVAHPDRSPTSARVCARKGWRDAEMLNDETNLDPRNTMHPNELHGISAFQGGNSRLALLDVFLILHSYRLAWPDPASAYNAHLTCALF